MNMLKIAEQSIKSNGELKERFNEVAQTYKKKVYVKYG